jgi:hypothetical protein
VEAIMALDYSDWAASGDEDASFDKAPFDFAGARSKLIARIGRTVKQLNGEKVSPQGGKDFEVLHNNGVHYRPTLNGHPIKLPGLDNGVRINRDTLKEKLTDFSRDVESGHFDDQLEAALAGSSTGTRGGRANSGGQGGGAKSRQSKLAERADGLPHRVPASEPQPHPDYTLNKMKTHWRSPEQRAKDAASYASRSAGK